MKLPLSGVGGGGIIGGIGRIIRITISIFILIFVIIIILIIVIVRVSPIADTLPPWGHIVINIIPIP
jgi:hypothetical protein